MKKIIIAMGISTLLLAPAIGQAKDFCYTGAGAGFRLSLIGKCFGKGKERYSSVVGKAVLGGSITVPISGSCVSRKDRVLLSLLGGQASGTVPFLITAEGSVPAADLAAGFDNAPLGDPQVPFTMTPIACADLEAGVTPFSQKSAASTAVQGTGLGFQ